AGVAAVLAPRVDEHELSGSERSRSRSEVQDCGVPPAGHNRVEGEKVGTATEELGFQVDLDLTLRPLLGNQLVEQEIARAGCLLRRTHPCQFDVVFGTTHISECVAEIVLEVSVRGGADDSELVGEVPRCGGSRTPATQMLSGERRLAVGHLLTFAGEATCAEY